MTPEERDQVTDLFDRLAALEANPRDPEAERLIQDGLRREPPRAGSVPTVRPGEPTGAPMGAPPGYQAQPMSQQPMPQQPMAQPSPGGSFLGTAAAAAVGVVGGALLADSIRGMMMGHHGGGPAHAAFNPAGAGQAPW